MPGVRELDMSLRPSSATLALTAAFGCTLELGPTSTDTAANTANATTGPAGTDSGTSSDSPTSTGSGGTTSETTNVGPTTTEGTTGEPAPVWCNGLDPNGPATLTVANSEGVDIIDGTPLQIVCGGQGTTMVPIYPHFGGFTPDSDVVAIDVILDVDGFNLGADGHFFAEVPHQQDVNCAYSEPYYDGYSYAFIPMFPPDAIPDIMVLDGKPGVLHVTLHSPIGDKTLDAKVVLSIAPEFSCGYGGYDTDTDGGSTSGGSTGGGSTGGTSG
jgi:hypothetical protein